MDVPFLIAARALLEPTLRHARHYRTLFRNHAELLKLARAAMQNGARRPQHLIGGCPMRWESHGHCNGSTERGIRPDSGRPRQRFAQRGRIPFSWSSKPHRLGRLRVKGLEFRPPTRVAGLALNQTTWAGAPFESSRFEAEIPSNCDVLQNLQDLTIEPKIHWKLAILSSMGCGNRPTVGYTL